MRKKGEQNQMGVIIGVFMLIIVGLVLMTASARLIGDTINTRDVANDTISNTNGTTLANIVQLDGKVASNVVVYNDTGDIIVGSGNYTIYNNQVIDGEETAGINVSVEEVSGIEDGDWQISYTSQPTTYISNSGGRAVAGLIVLFFALAIAIIAIFPTARSKIFG